MQSQVSKFDYFLAFVSIILNEALENIEEYNVLEKQSIRLTIYSYFEDSLDIEEVYHKILDYFDNQKPELSDLIPKVEIFFNTKLNQ